MAAMAPPPSPPLSYGALRRLWSAARLRDLLRRRRTQLLLALAVPSALGGDLSTAWQVAQSLLMAVVAPLSHGLAGTAAQGLLTAAWAGACLRWVWNPAWRDSEAALPLPARTRVQADLALLAWALLPWWTLQGAGLALTLWHRAAGLGAAQGATLGAAVLLSQGLGLAAGLALLHRARQRHAGRRRPAAAPPARPPRTRPQGWRQALLWQPLRSGHAPALRREGLLQTAMLVAAAATPLLGGVGPRGAAALLSLLALLGLPRLNRHSGVELSPRLAAAATTLPLDGPRLEAARRRLLLVPALLGLLAGAAMAVALSRADPALAWRPLPLLAWLALLLGTLWRLSAPPPPDPMDNAPWNGLSAVAVLALAGEILESP